MKKIALVVIAGMVMVLGWNNNVRAAYVVDKNITFSSNQGGVFRYTDGKNKIIHRITSTNDKGIYNVQYEKRTIAQGSGVYSIFFGNITVKGSIAMYKLARMQKAGDDQWGTFRGLSPDYNLLVLNSVIDSHYSIDRQGLEAQLPVVVGIIDWSKNKYNPSQLSHLAELISGDVLGFQGSQEESGKYKTATLIYKVSGGDNETFPRYIKAASNYISASAKGQRFQDLRVENITEQTSGLEEKLQQAKNKCKEIFVQPISQGSALPPELKNRYEQKEFGEGKSLADILGPVSRDTFKDFDGEFYKTFYSSDGKESDVHFLPGSVPYNSLADMSELFSSEAGKIEVLQGDADLENIKNWWHYTKELARKYSGIYQGILIGINDNNKVLIHKMLLAEYYIQKHLEYHECVLNEGGKDDLPASNEYSQENLEKEVRSFESLSNVTLDMDIDTQKGIEENIDDCGFEFFSLDTLNKVFCSMYKLAVGASASFADMAVNFFARQFMQAGSAPD